MPVTSMTGFPGAKVNSHTQMLLNPVFKARCGRASPRAGSRLPDFLQLLVLPCQLQPSGPPSSGNWAQQNAFNAWNKFPLFVPWLFCGRSAADQWTVGWHAESGGAAHVESQPAQQWHPCVRHEGRKACGACPRLHAVNTALQGVLSPAHAKARGQPGQVWR